VNPKLIACRVMIDEIRPFLSANVATEVFEISLHVNPDRLREALQVAINSSDGIFDPIYLGYGLCSKAVIGLTAQDSRLVIPRSNDCIEIFLGSRKARIDQLADHPGTYFLTHGYIGDGASMIFSEYERSLAKYGREKAERLLRAMMKHYDRLVYIRTPHMETPDSDRVYAEELARRLELHYVEIEGTSLWLQRMMNGEWNEDFVVVQPGERIELKDFLDI
jgi:hypothetical protein